jgi:hypothetical protein
MAGYSQWEHLPGKDDLIREYLDKKIPVSVMARLLNVNRLTLRNYIRTRRLQKPASEKRSYWIPGSWHLRVVYTDDISCRDPSQESNRAGQH